MALPKSVGIKLYDDTFVPVLTDNEVKSKRLVLTTVKDNQQKVIIELYEGTSDKCINNEYLGKLVISIERSTKKGEPGIEVNLRLSEDGMLYAKAWDSESGSESEIKIEHNQTERIKHETLSDLEINRLGGETKTFEKVGNFSEDELDSYEEEKEKKDFFPIIKRILAIIIILIILALLGLLGYYIFKNVSKSITENNKETEEVKIEETPKDATKDIVIKKEPIGIQSTSGKRHYIRWGDNLWNICKKYYNDPWYYPSLAETNNIKKPRKIYAGTYITIPDKSDLKRWDFKK